MTRSSVMAARAARSYWRTRPVDRAEVTGMRFIQEFGFDVKLGQDEAFQRWLSENEEHFAASVPQGVKYVGTFATIYSSEKKAGSYRVFFELDSYGAQDRIAAAAKDPSSDYGRMLREQSAFIDFDHNAGGSNALHKAVADATVWDPQG